MTRYCVVLAAVLMVAAPGSTSAGVVWSWSFDEILYMPDSHDSIVVMATLVNDPSSTAHLANINGVSANFGGDLQYTYDFTFGPTGNSSEFGIEFSGMDLAPGESFSFTWGILTPRGGEAPPGTYVSDPAHLGLSFPGNERVGLIESTNGFVIDVPAQVTVPEPASMILFGLGVLGSFRFMRKRRSSR